ncbi:MAG: limonene-1,2-epoxide hydrolase family protein [Acidimicrobiia bacterium]
MADSEQVVREFCDAWSKSDLDRIMSFFADDAVYHNIPMDPVVGTEAIRTFIEGFTAMVDRIEFEILHLAVNGNVVLTERVDTFIRAEGAVGLPVMGTFELADGKITAWRDYFDMAQVTAAFGG